MATLAQEQLDISRLSECSEDELAPPGFVVAARGLVAGTAVVRFPAGQSFIMVPHAIRFANGVLAATGADSFGTYAGHSPTPERAEDCFTSVPGDRRAPETPGLKVLGDEIAEFAVERMDEYGIDYVIWRQHIYNPEIAEYWRQMEDRGGVTNNHFDHVHVSFNLTASGVVIPPPIDEGADSMALSVRYIYDDRVKKERLDWVFDGPSRIWGPVGTPDVLKACDAVDMPELGEIGEAGHNWFGGMANGWK